MFRSLGVNAMPRNRAPLPETPGGRVASRLIQPPLARTAVHPLEKAAPLRHIEDWRAGGGSAESTDAPRGKLRSEAISGPPADRVGCQTSAYGPACLVWMHRPPTLP